MKKLLLLFVMMLLSPIVASAHDIEVNNADGVTIYYNYTNDGKELEVTFRGSKYDSYSNEYTDNVVIPDEVTFMNRTRKVTGIVNETFRDCVLTSVTIGNNVKSIGNAAFCFCYSLTSVTIGNSVTSIGRNAFHSCSGLNSITIPNSVTSIGDYAFAYCSGLTSVIIGNSVTNINNNTFYECSSLTSVTIGNSIKSIDKDAFRGCSGLKKVIVSNIAAWCGVKFASYDDNPLSIAKHLYSDENTEIKELVIPNNVTSISKYAFYGCSKLTSIEIPNGVMNIGEYAFYGCPMLTFVIIPNSVKSIGSDAFGLCFNLTNVTLNSNAIASNSYNTTSSIASFFGKQVKVYKIGEEVTRIGYYAFSGCTGLTSIEIPNSVTNIGNYAFYGCSKLTSITIPNNVTWIENGTFSGCSGLTSVTIPNSVTYIGRNAFQDCSGITSIEIPNNVTSIGDAAFRNCSSLTSVTIPNSVTSIGYSAFQSCSGLTSVTIGNSVTSIGSSAFDGVDIPTVVSLIENPFAITGKTSNSRTFTQNTFLNAALYVPKGAIEKYKATDGWKDFVFIEEGNPTGINTVEKTTNNNTTIYDLNGIRQHEPKKGVNIINGKKVVVK